MNMEKINVNSMEYRKLSKQDKLKVVNFKNKRKILLTKKIKLYITNYP